MKHLLLATAIATSTLALAQDPSMEPVPPMDAPPGTPPAPPKRPGPDGGLKGKFREQMRDRMLDKLPPDQRKRFEDARQKALEDPRIAALRDKAEAANREFFEAMRGKMNEIDPGLEDILKSQAGDRFKKGSDGGKAEMHGLGNLSEDERRRVLAAREVARQAPSVQAADAAREKASTPEERRTAGMEYMKALRAAILAADPSLGPVLEKLNPKEAPQPPPQS
jgi:hypothetical protein